MTRRTRRAMGGTPANNVSLGASAAVRPGRSPGDDAAAGSTLSRSPGKSPSQAVSKGASIAVRRMSTGGYMGPDDADGKKRLDYSRERNVKLGVPHYAKGGHARHKVMKDLHAISKILHSHFEGGSEPEEKKSGGRMWIQGAIKNKGALHKSLHVPEGKKIPISKLHKAEHSKSPTLRKRAQLAETLRGFHHKPQGR